MKISLNWLRDYVDFSGSGNDLADLLTFAGVEVASVTTRGAAIDKVILPATTVKLVALPPTTVFGQTVALTATVRPIAGGSAKPGGLVTFRDGDCVLGTAALVNGVATLKVPRLSVGTQRLTASYAGNGAFAASEASPINVIVWPARHGVVRRR